MSGLTTFVGLFTLLVGLVAWLGQALAFFVPPVAERLGVLEPRDDMDPTLYVLETRAEGLADMLLTWTLPAAALLLFERLLASTRLRRIP